MVGESSGRAFNTPANFMPYTNRDCLNLMLWTDSLDDGCGRGLDIPRQIPWRRAHRHKGQSKPPHRGAGLLHIALALLARLHLFLPVLCERRMTQDWASLGSVIGQLQPNSPAMFSARFGLFHLSFSRTSSPCPAPLFVSAGFHTHVALIPSRNGTF